MMNIVRWVPYASETSVNDLSDMAREKEGAWFDRQTAYLFIVPTSPMPHRLYGSPVSRFTIGHLHIFLRKRICTFSHWMTAFEEGSIDIRHKFVFSAFPFFITLS